MYTTICTCLSAQNNMDESVRHSEDIGKEQWINVPFVEDATEVEYEKTVSENPILGNVDKCAASKPKDMPVKRLYKCTSCSYSTYLRRNLYRHKKSVHERKRYVCDTCKKDYSYAAYLRKHIMSVHQQKLLICDQCSKGFKSQQSLKYHIAVTHDESKLKYKCAVCSKAFYGKEPYVAHLNSHFNTKPFSCEKCHKGFNYKCSYKRHLDSNCTGLKGITCAVCSKELKNKCTLREHMKGVHGSKDFKCRCGMSFSYASSLSRHRKNCTVLAETNNIQQERSIEEEKNANY